MPSPAFFPYRLRESVLFVVCGLAAAVIGAHAQTSTVRQLLNNGPNASRLVVAIMGDGYTAAQQEQFFNDAQRKIDLLVANEAFAPAKDLINGVAIFTASKETGTDIGTTMLRDTFYDTGFVGTVNSRLLTIATSTGRSRALTTLRDYAPDYDISVMLVNTTDYGGAGGSPTVVSLHALSEEILLHEIGHSFAGLADEYVDDISAPSYPPAEYANATQKTARAEIPWRAFLLDSVAIPTTAATTDANVVGFWEGAHYRATGFFRPIYDSKMRTLDRPWGPINLRAFAANVHRLNLNGTTAVPAILALSASAATATAGGSLSLTVAADGTGPLTYQWSFNGKFLQGQTGTTLTLTSLSSTHVGTYAVEVTNARGASTSTAAGIAAQLVTQGAGFAMQINAPTTPTTPTTPNGPTTPIVTQPGIVDPGRLINLSIRTDLTSSADNFTFGFVVGGAGTTGTKALLVRAAGPSLAEFGLSGVLGDPRLEFYAGSTKAGENDNWSGSDTVRRTSAQVGAFAYSNDASRDSALLLSNIANGSNSAFVSGTGAGTVLAELYDATPGASFTASTPRLVNVSVRKHLGGGVITGFVIGGSTSRTVLIRAIGPTLGVFGVSGVVADPQLALFSGSTQINANDNWGGTSALSTTFGNVGAFNLPTDSKDAALVTTLEPGPYTVQVNGVGGTTGVALIEVYEVP